jgi:hypothetical protein
MIYTPAMTKKEGPNIPIDVTTPLDLEEYCRPATLHEFWSAMISPCGS